MDTEKRGKRDRQLLPNGDDNPDWVPQNTCRVCKQVFVTRKHRIRHQAQHRKLRAEAV